MLDRLQDIPQEAPQRRRGQRKRVLVADLFCGAGGSSTGAQRALAALGYEMDLVCVNHWDVAIATHQLNHPMARHYCQDITALRPLEAVPEGHLDLLMASPSCVYHSRARGGRPTSDQQRMDPWQVIMWISQLRVKRLLIENVPEFVDYGPVNARTGRPVKSRKGEYFLTWLNALSGHGFRFDYKDIGCANYGDATTRSRFILMARSDGKPIVWPEPTHSRDGATDLFGERPRWRASREVIDWSIKGRSIFGRKRPLAPATLQRMISGARRHRWPEPFVVAMQRLLDGQAAPVAPAWRGDSLEPFVLGQQSCSVARSVSEPLPTISTAGAISLTEPMLAPYYGGGSGESCTAISRPMPTITTKARFGLVEPTVDVVAPDDSRYARAVAQGRVVLVEGAPHVLDVFFRMLEPEELARAMSFSDGDARYEFVGNKAERTKQIGNAVPVRTAAALVSAIMAI